MRPVIKVTRVVVETGLFIESMQLADNNARCTMYAPIL